MTQVVECVPNFSEGRDKGKINEITGAISAVSGVELLDVDMGSSTNRTVVTFAGTPAAAVEAAFQAIKKAQQVIDMTKHTGAHPRMGATDVCNQTIFLELQLILKKFKNGFFGFFILQNKIFFFNQIIVKFSKSKKIVKKSI